jgi:tetratricopeptide (TPR) repeat protein
LRQALDLKGEAVKHGVRGQAIASAASLALFLCPAASMAQYQQPLPPGQAINKAKAYAAYQKALEAFQNHDNNTCINLCKFAVNLDHQNKHLVHLLALAYAEAGDHENAIASFRTCLNMDYNFIPARNNYGMFLYKSGNLSEAQHHFEECIRIDAKYPDAYYHLGQILRDKGDLDHAIENFESAVRLNPNYFDAHRDLGLAIYSRVEARMGGEMNEAINQLQVAAKLVPDNPMIWYHLGVLNCAEGKLDDAESMFRTALIKDPQFAAAHWELGRLRYLRGDPDRCMAELKIALKVNPVYSESKSYPKVDPLQINEYLGTCYEVDGMLEDAVDAYKEVASMQKNNQATNKHISALIRELKAHHKSKNAADPRQVRALVGKGITEFENGDVNGAKASFEQAVELDPKNYEAVQNLGSALEALGDLNDAIAQYQTAKELKPDFPGAYYNLAYCLEKAHLQADAGMMYQSFHELAGRYPYDPRHIVEIQQEDARERARNEQLKKRGY